MPEDFHQFRHREVHGAQSHDSEDVRGVHDEGVERDREHSRDGIDGKQHIGGFDDRENEQQRSRVESRIAAPATDQELASLVAVGHRKPAAKDFHQRIFLGVDLMIRPHELDAAQNQHHAEHVKNPVEMFDQADPSEDKGSAQNQGSYNAPEQHPMLLFFGHGEEAEDHQKDKKV